MTSFEIHKIDPAEAIELINELDAYQESLYPSESNHLESLDQLSNPRVKMFGSMIDGELAAIGAVKLMDGYGEVKGVFVPSRHRGKGLAKKIMNRLGIHSHTSLCIDFNWSEDQLKQVLMNRISNAVESMSASKTNLFGDFVNIDISPK